MVAPSWRGNRKEDRRWRRGSSVEWNGASSKTNFQDVGNNEGADCIGTPRHNRRRTKRERKAERYENVDREDADKYGQTKPKDRGIQEHDPSPVERWFENLRRDQQPKGETQTWEEIVDVFPAELLTSHQSRKTNGISLGYACTLACVHLQIQWVNWRTPPVNNKRDCPMYQPHPSLAIPDVNAKLWRYMDLTKLLGIVATKTLRFTHISKFDDKYEGYVPVPSIEEYHELLKPLKEMLQSVLDTTSQTDPAILKVVKELFASQTNASEKYEKTIKLRKEARDRFYVNCWHLNENESAAMWQLYLRSNEGVAIQTTTERLIDTFNTEPRTIYIGKVDYIDFDATPLSNLENERAKNERIMAHRRHSFSEPITFPFVKRPSFSHEQEVRAVYMSTDDTPVTPGCDIVVDTEGLVENVYIAPTCQPWIKSLIESILDKYELKRAVKQSSLAVDPVW
jgi:hypothetical protein